MKLKSNRLLYRSLLIITIIFLLIFSFYKLIKSRSFQLFGSIYNHININEKYISLTFDDGPTKYTDSILSILNDENIKATFFLIGEDLKRNIEEGKKIVSAGHQIGNHSFSHKRMIFTSYSSVKFEIETTDSIIRACGFKDEIVFRPPYCKKFVALPYYLGKNNRKTVTWDIEPETDNYELLEPDPSLVLSQVKPGSIILLHCMEASRVESRKYLPKIIQELKKQGYIFKTVSELIDCSID